MGVSDSVFIKTEMTLFYNSIGTFSRMGVHLIPIPKQPMIQTVLPTSREFMSLSRKSKALHPSILRSRSLNFPDLQTESNGLFAA